MIDKGKGNEFIIDLKDEDFDYQYDSNVKTEFDEESMLGIFTFFCTLPKISSIFMFEFFLCIIYINHKCN